MAPALHAVAETASYLAAAKRCGLSETEQAAIVDQVARDPTDGDIVRGSGGVRKIRFGGSGGHRVMVAYLGPELPAYLLSVLSKGSAANFSATQVQAMQSLSKAIKRAWIGPGASRSERRST